MPSTPESLVGQSFGPQWKVIAHTADALVLSQQRPYLRRFVGTVVVTLSAGWGALVVAAQSPLDARVLAWSVSLLLGVVAALGLPATIRTAQHVLHGVQLQFTRETVKGWPVAAFALVPRTANASEVEKLSIHVFEHPPLSLALFEVVLRDGTTFMGPEMAVPQGEKHTLDLLYAAALKLIGSRSPPSADPLL
jgi:hypothetical protein